MSKIFALFSKKPFKKPKLIKYRQKYLYKWNTVHNGVTPPRLAVLHSPHVDDCTASKRDSKPLWLRTSALFRQWGLRNWLYLKIPPPSPPRSGTEMSDSVCLSCGICRNSVEKSRTMSSHVESCRAMSRYFTLARPLQVFSLQLGLCSSK